MAAARFLGKEYVELPGPIGWRVDKFWEVA